ncbi:MAG: hypothetical protein KKC37_17130, partial [Proteobacteria bacterium]|nr:hypothetical protein [Pseudomonadota bacterium]
VSVEIAHDFKEGAFYLPDENKFIAVKDAPSEMIECYSADGNITLYKGKKLAFAWGGERGSVHIAGTGITCNPADRETKLELCIASMSGEPILGKGGDKEMTIDLMKLSVEEINNLKFDLEELDLGSKWTRAYINDLPDSAFAIVSASVKKETDNKSKYRGFPYKDVDGKIDLAHIRNALARIAQAIKGNSSDFTNEELLAGQKKLVSAAIKSKIGDYASSVEEDYNSLMKWINIWEISRVFENEFGDLSNEIKESLLQAVILEEKKLIPSLVTVLGTTLSTNAIAVTKEEINSLIIEAVKLEKQKWEDEIQLEKDTQVKLQDRMNILHEEKFDIASEELISRIKGIPINEEGDKKFQAELTYMKSLRVVPKVDTNSLRSSIFSFPGGSFGNKGNGDGKENLDKKVENNTKINPMVLAL